MDTLTAIKQRFSAKSFSKGKLITKQNIYELIECAMHAPSACNLQHTRFLAITELEAKKVLQNVANDQNKIQEASVIFVILANLEAHKDINFIVERGVHMGLYDELAAKNMIQTALSIYADNPQIARDEAIRSASLAAMNLMTAAMALGMVSCPMGGFNRDALKTQFKIENCYLPIMLIAVGYEADAKQYKKPRLLPDEVMIFDARPGNSIQFGRR